jgi:hypothetical protein
MKSPVATLTIALDVAAAAEVADRKDPSPADL